MGRYKSAKDDMRFADFLSDIVVTFDPQFRHTYVNSAVEHFTGKKAQDFLGKTNRELGMPPELVGPWDEALGQVFRTGKSRDMAFSYSGPKGERHFLERFHIERLAARLGYLGFDSSNRHPYS